MSNHFVKLRIVISSVHIGAVRAHCLVTDDV
jgi:hypothetical protein